MINVYCYSETGQQSAVPLVVRARITRAHERGGETQGRKPPHFGNLQGSIPLLSELGSVQIVLRLCHSVATGGRLGPSLACVGSSLRVEFSKVLIDTGLLVVLGVVGGLPGFVPVTDLLVFRGGQAGGNVRVGADLAALEL